MKKILVVDDERLIRYALSAAFRRDGLEVTAAASAREGLAALQSGRYDVCFLDVHLPDGNGLDLLEEAQRIAPRATVVIMTAADLSRNQLQDLHDKGCLFLPKPFDLEHVRALIHGAGAPRIAVTPVSQSCVLQ